MHKVWSLIVLSALAFGLSLNNCGLAEWKPKPDNTPIPRYYDKRLRAIEDKLIDMEWRYHRTEPKVERTPPPEMEKYFKSLSDDDLAKISIWSVCACADNPRWHWWLYQSVYYGAMYEVGGRKRPSAKEALWQIAYQSTIDTHPGEALWEAFSNQDGKEFVWPVLLYFQFSGDYFKPPMTEEFGSFVISVRRSLWQQWRRSRQDEKAKGFSPDFRSRAEFDIVAGGKIKNLKMKVWQARKDPELTECKLQNYSRLVRETIDATKWPAKLPGKLTKVHVSVNLY